MAGRRKVDSQCWVFTGAKDSGGYGHAKVAGRSVSTHRAAYEVLVGPIPSGLQLDHLCRNRACYNPAHLEPVTNQENSRRGGLVRRLDRHGASWYANHGCRCDECRAAWAEYHRDYRRKRNEASR